MTDTIGQARLTITKEFLRSVGHVDVGNVSDLLAEQVSYHALGHNALAGVFSGRDQVIDHLVRFAQGTGETFDAFKWEDWMVGEHHVAALAAVHMQAAGMRYQGRQFFLLGFDTEDRIDRIAVFFEDEDAIDRFVGRSDM